MIQKCTLQDLEGKVVDAGLVLVGEENADHASDRGREGEDRYRDDRVQLRCLRNEIIHQLLGLINSIGIVSIPS